MFTGSDVVFTGRDVVFMIVMMCLQVVMCDEEEDPVVQEVDVYLSQQLTSSLYLLQYPVRPGNMKYDDLPHLGARIKPLQEKVTRNLMI